MPSVPCFDELQELEALVDELLNREIFYTVKEAQVLIEGWRRHYNRIRPRSSLGYRPPTPETAEWPRGATRPRMSTTMAALT
jgi:transposase InsO family protein